MLPAKPTAAPGLSPRFVTLITFVVVVAVLRVAEEIMIPVALALLLAFLLTPLVVRLTRWHLPKTLAITITVVFAFGLIAVAAWQIAGQTIDLLDELPRYETNLHRKVADLKQPQATGSLSRTFITLEKMWSDLQAPAPTSTSASSAAAKPTRDAPRLPVPVEVHTVNRSSFELARTVAAGLFKPLGTAGIVIVLVIAILFQREDLRSRFIHVISGGQLNLATEAVDDAARRVSRYLFAQLLVNTCFGLAIGLGLFLIGIPHAPLWGLLATLLRFIPYLGPLIAASCPLLLAVAVDPGWAMLGWTALLYIAVEILTNYVVELLVYGTSTGISTLALLAAAIFWSWLWGLPGLLVSTPLTVCLLVLGQNVPGLRFLGVLLGSEPPLSPPAEFYQRMLAMDHEEMFNLAEAFVAERSLAAFYDEVFVPALLMAEVDRHRGRLAEVRQKFIFTSSRELIEELGLHARAGPDRPPPPATGTPDTPRILGLPARDEADELVALMLADLLRAQGFAVTVSPANAAPEERRAELQSPGLLVFVSALPPDTLSAAARTARRVQQLNPSAHLVVGLWSSDAKADHLQRRLAPAGAIAIVTQLAEAVVQLTQLANASPRPAPAAFTAAGDTATADGAMTPAPFTFARSKPEEAVDTVVRELARAFDVPISLVSVLELDREFWRPIASDTAAPFPSSPDPGFDGVLDTEILFVVDDLAKDERLSTHPLLVKRGVRFLATAPLRTAAGRLVGNICVLDTQPRAFSDTDRERLLALAAQLIAAVEPLVPAPPPPGP